MEETIIEKIARQIVNDEILLNWKFYCLIGTLQLLLLGAVSFFTKYFEKRGELLATKADYKEILRQLEKSTETAEGIKTTLAHKDWTEKEYKTLRRMKLEEFLNSVHIIQDWFDEIGHKTFIKNAEQGSVASVKYRVILLAKLYFPEFKEDVPNFRSKCADIHLWSLQVRQNLFDIVAGSNEEKDIIKTQSIEMRKHILELNSIVLNIEQKAEEIMQKLIDYR